MQPIVFITGASSGIGKATAQHLLTKGYKVYGTSRNAENGAFKEGVHWINLDVSSEKSIAEAFAYYGTAEKCLDVLINNAGIGMVGAIEDSSITETEKLFNTNFYGVLEACRQAIPYLSHSKNAKILQIASLAAILPLPFRGMYSASKAALLKMSEALRIEIAQFGITVSVLSPGDFQSNIAASRVQATAFGKSRYKAQFENVQQTVNKGIREAKDPIVVAKKIEKILSKKRPKFHYKIATPTQMLATHLKYWLPDNWTHALIKHNQGM